MINGTLLEELLDLANRGVLFDKIMRELKYYGTLNNCQYLKFETSEGNIPIIIIGNPQNFEEVKCVKLFIGAQHNEYTGLFGIMEFLRRLNNSLIPMIEVVSNNQIVIFAPLMNPYGFINPTKEAGSKWVLPFFFQAFEFRRITT